METEENINDIAIVGMAGRFPGAKNLDKFWRNLENGVESIRFFDEQELLDAGISKTTLQKSNYVKASPTLEDADMFDAHFFNFSPSEAALTDPQQRVFMECAWEALENAGYKPGTDKYQIGVYGGANISKYLLYNLLPGCEEDFVDSLEFLLGNDKDHLCTHTSYKLNLNGPSVGIQTACSTSLVAVSVACKELLSYQCDIALAGGVSVNCPLKSGYHHEKGSIFSSDGHCRTFDENAEGTIFGSGVGIVVLKRLEDAIEDRDYIYAVIKGSATNNDGNVKVGYTAPSIKGQSEVIAMAQAVAEIAPQTISYIEAHGTGTPIGDPIEIAALADVFRAQTSDNNFCAIGSVKTNIGHLGAAAGIAGLIKTVLALKKRLLPPSLNFEKPNPRIDFANSPFYVNTKLREWQGKFPLRAGVSSFGMGGTNAHVILEESKQRKPTPVKSSHLFVLSAKSEWSLEKASHNLAVYLKETPDVNLQDIAWTLSVGRSEFNHRRIVVGKDSADIMQALKSKNENMQTLFLESSTSKIVFMFSGQGTQYSNMTKNLYECEPTYRKHVDLCANILQNITGTDIRKILFSPENDNSIHQTEWAQPALFVIEYSLAKLWMDWGIEPTAMVGHSIGEYVAACIAGVFSLEDALAIVALRGKSMQNLPEGKMLAVALSENEVQNYLNDGISIAAVNGPELCVISGTSTDIAQLETTLSAKNITTKILETSHAFHSEMISPMLGELRNKIANVERNIPEIPYLSNVTGTWIRENEAIDPDYWVKHTRQKVDFSSALKQLFIDEKQILLEIGAGNTLGKLALSHPDNNKKHKILASIPGSKDNTMDLAFVHKTLGELWLEQVDIDWERVYFNDKCYRIPLPTYPFEHQRYWIEPKKVKKEFVLSEETTAKQEYQKSTTEDKYVAPRDEDEQKMALIWQELLGIEKVGIHDNFAALGGHSMLAVKLISRIRKNFQIEIPIESLFEEITIAMLVENVKNIRWASTQTEADEEEEEPEL